MRHNNTHYIAKRVGIVVIVLLSVSSGLFSPEHKVSASSYYTSISYSSEVASSKMPVHTTNKPKRRMVILSTEVIQRLAPSPTPTPVWGKARQIDEHTWTVDIGEDPQMASALEVLTALNVYRGQKGKGGLTMDAKLSEFAQNRANFFTSNKDLDGHAGFNDYIHNQDGFTKLGFFALGENSSLGYQVTGTHLIEWVYAGDKPHDDNQLSSDWTHVGIGISGDATDLIFGGNKQ